MHPIAIVVIVAVIVVSLLTGILSLSVPDRPEPDPVAIRAAEERETEKAFDRRVILLRVEAKVWLRKNLKDPSSLEVVSWSRPVTDSGGGLSIAVTYRATNSFGAGVVETRLFSVDADGILTRSEDIGRLPR